MSTHGIAKTRILVELFSVPSERRDEPWRERFLAAIPDAELLSFDPQSERGPDEFPYFHLALPDVDNPFAPVSVGDVLEHCLENALGIVIFENADRAGPPAWVFRYGSLLSYKLYGSFDHNPAEAAADGGSQTVITHDVHEVLLSSPSESYLPGCARRAMAGFFRATLQHPDPRIILVDDPKMKPMRKLMVNLKREHYYGDGEKLRAALEYLSWFLPGNYSLISMPDDWSEERLAPLA